MEGINVTFSKSALYLGVTLDRKLNWQDHIQNKIDKSKKLLQSLAHLVSDNFGPKPHLLLWAYIVRPALTYASMNWGHALEGKCVSKKLVRLDRLALLTASRVHMSTPTKGLQIIYEIPPLHLFIKQTGAMTYARLQNLLPYDWWWFLVLLLLPDIGMIGYFFGNKTGAFVYNVFHHKGIALVIYLFGVYLVNPLIQLIGIILFAHSAMDRIMGYGLKYDKGFKYTHLGEIGNKTDG
jgi:hypothetical protein